MLVRDVITEVKGAVGSQKDADALKWLNRGVKLLADSGHWRCLERTADTPVSKTASRLVLPSCVGTPLEVALDGSPKEFVSQWVELTVNGPGPCSNVPSNQWRDAGTSHTMTEWTGKARLAAVGESVQDGCHKVLVFGKDETGRSLRSQREDGSWVEGLLLPVNRLSDFPMGLVVPPEHIPVTRVFQVVGPTDFAIKAGSSNPFVTGASVTVAVTTGSLVLEPVLDTYYVRLSDGSVTLHPSRLDAKEGTNAVRLAEWTSDAELTLSLTLDLQVWSYFEASKAHLLDSGDPVSFSAGTLPAGFTSGRTYFASKVSDTRFRLHDTASDATAGANPILPCDAGADLEVGEQHDFLPETLVRPTSPARFAIGDAVYVDAGSYGSTPGGFPTGQTLFWNPAGTLHTSQSEAVAGSGALRATSGTGGRIYRLLTGASANLTSDAVTVAEDHRLNSGDVVIFNSTGTPPAPLVAGDPYFVRDVLGPKSFNLASGSLVPAITGEFTVSDSGVPTTTGVDFTMVLDSPDYYAVILKSGTTLQAGDQVVVNDGSSPPAEYADGLEFFVVQSTVTGFDTNYWALSATLLGAPVAAAGAGDGDVEVDATNTLRQITLPAAFSTLAGTSDKVRVSASGSLPFGLLPDTDYFVILVGARLTLSASAGGSEILPTSNGVGVFTVSTVATKRQPVDFTSEGSGALSVISASAFDLEFTSALWVSDTSTFAVSEEIEVGTESSLPTASPALLPGTTYFVAPTASDKVRLYATTGLLDPVTVSAFGAGRSYLLESFAVTVQPDGGKVTLFSDSESDEFLAEDARGQLLTPTGTGAVPPGLTALTTYAWKKTGLLRVPQLGGVAVPVTDIGECPNQVAFSTSVVLSSGISNIHVPNHEFRLGDCIRLLDPTGSDELPGGLAVNTCYYVRPVPTACGSDSILLFDTESSAVHEGCNTGLVKPTSEGIGTHRLQFLRANPWVCRIEAIRKDITQGVVSVYANTPNHTIPQVIATRIPANAREQLYRTIRITPGRCWARIKFRHAILEHTSLDEPLLFGDSTAVILAVRAAKLLADGDIAVGREILASAKEILSSEQRVHQPRQGLKVSVSKGFHPGNHDNIR